MRYNNMFDSTSPPVVIDLAWVWTHVTPPSIVPSFPIQMLHTSSDRRLEWHAFGAKHAHHSFGYTYTCICAQHVCEKRFAYVSIGDRDHLHTQDHALISEWQQLSNRRKLGCLQVLGVDLQRFERKSVEWTPAVNFWEFGVAYILVRADWRDACFGFSHQNVGNISMDIDTYCAHMHRI